VSGYLGGLVAILSLNVILGYAVFLPTSVGIISLGTAGFSAIGAYLAAYLNAEYGFSIALATATSAVLTGLAGFVIAFGVLRTQGVYIVLATFAFSQLATGIIINIDAVGGASGYPVLAFAPTEVLALCAAAVVVVVVALYATRLGLAMRALHDDEAVATLFGVNIRMTKAVGFALGAALAGMAGGLYGFQYGFLEVQTFSNAYSIYTLLFVLLGGTQTAWGPLLGAAIYSLLPEALRGSAEWRYVIFGAAIVGFMMFRPEGLLTRTSMSFRRRRARPLGGVT
jgi:branched-chain amino acid transport system permease protein